LCVFFPCSDTWSKYSQKTDHASKKLLKSYVELKEFYVLFLYCFLKQNLNLPQICKEKKYKNVTSRHHEMQACNKQLTKPAPKIDKKKKGGNMVCRYAKSLRYIKYLIKRWRHGFLLQKN